jgi:ABC-2 type transport system ATP-binding protein
MIEFRDLTKRYGRTLAVDALSFTVRPGIVTGFLGPNGAGKSTTMRLALGLDAPTAGEALVAGCRYRDLQLPLRKVGALLDATAVDGGRTAADHLGWLARSNRIPRARARSLLEQVGLAEVAGHRVGTFSLGMKQRLGIAAALLGDPEIVMLDEPVNGLDPDGVRWIRELLRSLAAEGRTVFVSSHLMSEMAITADRLVVIARGRLVADATVEELAGQHGPAVYVRTPLTAELLSALERAGARATSEPDGRMSVTGLDAAAIGELATRHAIPLTELMQHPVSLEDAYMRLTADRSDFVAGPGRGHGDD